MGKSYKTAEACKALDVQPYVLRYWETEFSALKGKKSGAQRVYSEQELRILKRIKELLYDEGYTMGGAKKRLNAELEDGETEAAPEQKKPPKASSAKAKKAKSDSPSTKSTPKKAAAASETGSGKAKPKSEPALDTEDRVKIETTLLQLRKLHAEAEQILSLVRAAK